MQKIISSQEDKTEETSGLEMKLDSTNANDKTNNRSFLRKAADLYFEPKSFEKWENGRLYEYLGARYVQKAVMGTVGKLTSKIVSSEKGDNYIIGRRHDIKSLKRFEWRTRFNETVHTFGEAWIVGWALLINYKCYDFAKELEKGNYDITMILGTGLLLNGALVMLQRYNRARVHNIIEKKEKRKNIF